ncbi:ZrgA family zinc uptake protein [Ferrimonas gelatinilytica]|uniref:DUF2796 domain-containing protein n=1 Tax=Ferrimonas gelatinilytica TaxID=1255257 RepID=A0ABP9S136_9GAMM
MKSPAVLTLAALALTACHPHEHDHPTSEGAHSHVQEEASSRQSSAEHSAQGDHHHRHGEAHEPTVHQHGDMHQHGAHQHGVGTLTLMQQDNEVQLSLEIDTDALWGFERAPANDEEREQIRRVLKQLSAGHRFFSLSDDAQCEPSQVEIQPPAGLEPDADGDAASDHMSLAAHWRWDCADAGLLHSLDLTLFDHYPSIHQLHLQRLTQSGSGGAQLDASQPGIQW